MSCIVLIDNYDSFTYNLYQYVLMQLKHLPGTSITVVRNDEISIEKIQQISPAGILISPGPGKPSGAGVTMACIEYALKNATPLLGVCLGHQAIAEVLGARIVRAPLPLHGYTCTIKHDGSGIFSSIPDEFTAMRYHSLMVDAHSIPTQLYKTAHATEDAVIMGLRVHGLPAWGVQFHPESFLTEHGELILFNFLKEVFHADCASIEVM